MAKKHKRKLQKSAQKAAKTVRKHGPLTGSVVALGGFFSSMLASQKLRDSVEEFMSSALSRAAKVLGGATVDAGEAIKALPESLGKGDHDEHDTDEPKVEMGRVPTHETAHSH